MMYSVLSNAGANTVIKAVSPSKITAADENSRKITIQTSIMTTMDYGSWTVTVNGQSCTSPTTSTVNGAIGITCIAPSLKNGKYTVAVSSTKYGNFSAASALAYGIDETAPVVTLTTTSKNTVAYSATDNIAVRGYYVSTSSTAPTVGSAWNASAGTITMSTTAAQTYYVWAIDTYDNISSAKSVSNYKLTVSDNGGSGCARTVYGLAGYSWSDYFSCTSSRGSDYMFMGWDYSSATVPTNNNSTATAVWAEVIPGTQSISGLTGGVRGTDFNLSGISYCKKLTADQILVNVTKISQEYPATGTATYTKSYNASSCTLTVYRSAIEGDGIITWDATIYTAPSAKKIGTISFGYPSGTINCTGISGYQNLTADNFILDMKTFTFPDGDYGTMYYKKTYNASTGILTVSRGSMSGGGTVTQSMDVYYWTK